MSSTVKGLSIVVLIFAVVSLAMGIVFIQQGFAKEEFLVEAMQQELITFEGVEGFVDSAEKALVAGDTVREHRHGIAPTYGDLLGGERFNPTETKQLSYAQALNIENYLYIAAASFGLLTIVMGLALGSTGFGLLRVGS